MPDAATEARRVVSIDAAGRRAVDDPVAVEAPLEIRCAGEPLAVVLRTPGDDLDLVRGLLHAEGVLDATDPDAVAAVARDPVSGDVFELGLDPAVVAARWPRRTLATTAACGACGKESIEALATRAAPVASDLAVPVAQLLSLPDRLRTAQLAFAATGGLHGAALAPDGATPICVREDVGRHNAVDKVIGWAVGAGRLPLADCALVVSGRLGFEIVQKAIVAGIPIVVAVGAASSFAIDLGERFRVTLCGFARGGRLNVYSHAWRVL